RNRSLLQGPPGRAALKSVFPGRGFPVKEWFMSPKAFFGVLCLLALVRGAPAGAQSAKLVVAYASPAATFCPGFIARREGLFARYGLDVELVLMQGASAYMPALANGNIQVLYGGGTAVSRAIATGGFDLVVIATETRYVPLRLMVNASNEYDLEKAGYRELANFLDFKMPYAGVPHTVSRAFRDKNRKVLEDYMTAMVEGMQIFRADRQKAYRAIFELTRQKDPVLLERTYDSYARQYDAIGGVPLPWEAGIESMITGFHERFNPQGIKNRDAKPFIDPSFVQKAVERLKLNRK